LLTSYLSWRRYGVQVEQPNLFDLVMNLNAPRDSGLDCNGLYLFLRADKVTQ